MIWLHLEEKLRCHLPLKGEGIVAGALFWIELCFSFIKGSKKATET